MNVLGLANLDNASAAIIARGELIAACEEERFVREKHYCGFPWQAVEFSLQHAGLQLDELDEVAIGWIPLRGVAHRAWTTLAAARKTRRLRAKASRGGRYLSIIREQLRSGSLLKRRFSGSASPLVRYVNHHFAHLACAYFMSPFEQAAAMSIDGTGEYQTGMLARIVDGKIEKLGDIRYPHSLGHLYSVFTAFLGFKPNSAEGSVMGLAAYGEPAYADALRQFVHFDADRCMLRLNPRYVDYAEALNGSFPTAFLNMFGEPRMAESDLTDRHRDIAASIQHVAEEIIIGLARTLHRDSRMDNLCLSGGVALNCVANAKVLEQTPFRRIYVPSAPSDAGVSLGAAMYRYHLVTGNRPYTAGSTACLGPAFSTPSCAAELRKQNITFQQVDNPESRAAELLAEGKIVGWFQGAMEFGPRALGSRSILAAPYPEEMKDTLNGRVKFRESFRPFAPIVLEGAVHDWFDVCEASPYMSFAFEVRPEKRSRIPAVTHVDGRARLQTVSPSMYPRLARLLDRYAQLVGVPILLNTSFNVRGEPIVCTPADAIRCFARTEMDCLFLGNCIIWH